MCYNFEKKNYTLMSAKCNGIIKYLLSLKMKKKKLAPVPLPKRLFSVQPVFFATYKKTLETNICVKYVIYKFCLWYFSLKCIIKKNYLHLCGPLRAYSSNLRLKNILPISPFFTSFVLHPRTLKTPIFRNWGGFSLPPPLSLTWHLGE